MRMDENDVYDIRYENTGGDSLTKIIKITISHPIHKMNSTNGI